MKDFWAEELQNQRKGKLKKLSIFIVCMILLCAIITLILVYLFNLNFRMWCDNNILIKEIKQDKTRNIDLDGDENIQIYAYDKYICIFRNKTLEIYNKVGTKIESIDLDINVNREQLDDTMEELRELKDTKPNITIRNNQNVYVTINNFNETEKEWIANNEEVE